MTRLSTATPAEAAARCTIERRGILGVRIASWPWHGQSSGSFQPNSATFMSSFLDIDVGFRRFGQEEAAPCRTRAATQIRRIPGDPACLPSHSSCLQLEGAPNQLPPAEIMAKPNAAIVATDLHMIRSDDLRIARDRRGAGPVAVAGRLALASCRHAGDGRRACSSSSGAWPDDRFIDPVVRLTASTEIT